MGRWAWSSDAFDFDSDGWEDLYVVNGMLTRRGAAAAEPDLDSFFWRQVVARSPLTRIPGTPYDDAWRATNQLLVHGSIASHERNVFLRNDGHGGFDEVSGALGLDLDQDGRSFARARLRPRRRRGPRADGRAPGAAAAALPQRLRDAHAGVGRSRPAALAVRLAGVKSNRDAIGARVTVETDRMRRTKTVQAGSGFLSQHSKELLFGLGASERIVSADRRLAVWRRRRPSPDFRSTRASASSKAATPETEPFAAATGGGVQHDGRAPRRGAAARHLALRAVPGARLLADGRRAASRDRSTRCVESRRSCCCGRPRVPAARAALETLAARRTRR